MTKPLDIFIDGASKGNPGPAGIGVVISCDGHVLQNHAKYIGTATNNVAEYSALIYALLAARILKAKHVAVKSDSQLLCRQINGRYKVKNAAIICLYMQVRQLLNDFQTVTVKHIPREENRGADLLANKAVKEALKMGHAACGHPFLLKDREESPSSAGQRSG